MTSDTSTIKHIPCDTVILGDVPDNITFLIDIESELERMREKAQKCRDEMNKLSYFTKALPDALSYVNKHIHKLKRYQSMGMIYVSYDTYARDI